LVPQHCICERIVRHVLPIRIVVIRHNREVTKSSNTARLAGLCLDNLEIRDQQPMARSVDVSDLQSAGTMLLFPTDEPPPGSLNRDATDGLHTLVVPDGSWRQVRRMVRKMPVLDGLPRFSLNRTRQVARVLTPPTATSVSTIEAVAMALGQLGYRDCESDLCEVYDAFSRASALQRGKSLEPGPQGE